MTTLPSHIPTRTGILATLLLSGAALAGTDTHPGPASAANDAAWTRAFAIPADQLQPPSPISSQGRENDLNGDPRFAALLRSSFHQQQWFWHDHHRFVSVADLVQTFIGIPGDAILSSNRFVTVNGCVPHDCTDLGLLWIDTGVRPASLLFAATQLMVSVNVPDQTHLWIFASQHQNFSGLPPDFLANLNRWRDAANADKYLRSTIVVVTLVQPNGQQTDLTYDTLFDKQHQPGAKQ